MNTKLKDIATKAGVSVSTVSRVINNYPFVKESTRKKVMRVVKELNYYPDLVARSLVKQRTYNIGLIIGSLSNPFFAETAELIVKKAEQYDCHVTLCVSKETGTKVEDYINFLITKRVDGMIIGSIFKDESVESLMQSDIPYVLYNRKVDNQTTDYIITDNQRGAFEAVTHLIRLGNTKIGILHGPSQLNTVAARLKGYYQALSTYNIRIREHFVQEVGFVNPKSDIREALEMMFQKRERPTAIFTSSDFLALDAMEYLLEKGYRIPEDVAVVGFDNIRLSGHRLISLTTVAQRIEEMASLAVERLIQRISNKEQGKKLDPWKIQLQPKLIVRRSCGSEERG